MVRWRHFAVLFCEWAECRHVFSLVESDRATRFESPTAASEVSLAMIEARTKRYADDQFNLCFAIGYPF